MLKSFAVSVKNFLVSEDGPTAVEYAAVSYTHLTLPTSDLV